MYFSNILNTDQVLIETSQLNFLMYADDIVLFSTSVSLAYKTVSRTGLQNYSKEWKMDVSLNKTKTIVLNKESKHVLKLHL